MDQIETRISQVMRQELASGHPPLNEETEDFPIWRREFLFHLQSLNLPLEAYIRAADPTQFQVPLVPADHQEKGRMALDHVITQVLQANVEKHLLTRIRSATHTQGRTLFLALEQEFSAVTPQDRYHFAVKFLSTTVRRADEIWAEDFSLRYINAQTCLDFYIPENQKPVYMMLAYLDNKETVETVLNDSQFNPESMPETHLLVKRIQRNFFPDGWPGTDGLFRNSRDAEEQEANLTFIPQLHYCKLCQVKHGNTWACTATVKHAQRLLSNGTGHSNPNSNKKKSTAYPHVYKTTIRG
jgi:hypothetical protein